ncbi:hypothetical protein SLA_0499 [Streptomyces laurentii]|uniref:Uncharacterized protein n=1 Tax=Streptomyces laurentii TaxID=39478 RepID=A0A160NU99_STRLU|nr:hypothetical protein SLA_0499 [Streptomyces laurentii]
MATPAPPPTASPAAPRSTCSAVSAGSPSPRDPAAPSPPAGRRAAGRAPSPEQAPHEPANIRTARTVLQAVVGLAVALPAIVTASGIPEALPWAVDNDGGAR